MSITKLRAPEFPVSSDACRLLLLLESTGSVKDAAQELQRDISVVSRQVAQLARGDAGHPPLVEKLNGRWQVSPEGKRLSDWARDAILDQRRVLENKAGLRIAATREFAARVLAPGLAELIHGTPGLEVTVIATEHGVEPVLLAGDADLGLDCGRPTDPSLRFQRVTPEPFVLVAAPGFTRLAKLDVEGLLKLPHLQYTRYSTARGLKLASGGFRPLAVFNDLGAIRGAAVAGLGWAIMPRYTVRQELDAGTLIELRGPTLPVIEPEQFGVWWHRDRPALEPWAKSAIRWLKAQAL